VALPLAVLLFLHAPMPSLGLNPREVGQWQVKLLEFDARCSGTHHPSSESYVLRPKGDSVGVESLTSCLKRVLFNNLGGFGGRRRSICFRVGK
jgi:hypothetical protein